MGAITKKETEVIKEVQDLYVKLNLPWVVGYSGGKDSTCTLQIVWKAILDLPQEKRNQPLYVISSDTLVEAPPVADYLHGVLAQMKKSAKKGNLPIHVQCVYPDPDKTFWVNLLGRGYPAPRTKFRWCTDRLKIEPANNFIKEIVSKHGEAVMVLGARSSESSSRAQVLAKNQSAEYFTAGAMLPRHTTLPNAFVYTPIKTWTTPEVWEYLLLNTQTPWGTSNRDLAAMYKEASDGECPLVVDKSTPSCGNSRFGCWVCTVVESNKSLENSIDNGQAWLEPLLRFWNILKDTVDPEKKAKYRSFKRRTGLISVQKNADTDEIKLILGPYKFEYRKSFLKQLLLVEKEINIDPNKKLGLISEAELRTIRQLWITEENDWEDSLPRIYKEVTGKDLVWDVDDSSNFGKKELEILNNICLRNQVPTNLVARLLDKEKEFTSLGRRSTLSKELLSILKEEWRTQDEVMSELKQKRMAKPAGANHEN